MLLGDAAAMTDGQKGNEDDRWIFTENNPGREMQTAAQLAAISRAMKGFNDTLSVHSLCIAKEIFETQTAGNDANPRLLSSRLHAAVELFLTTGEKKYTDYVLANQQAALQNINQTAWFICRGAERWRQMKDKKVQRFLQALEKAIIAYQENINKSSAETPYGVPLPTCHLGSRMGYPVVCLPPLFREQGFPYAD